MEKLFLFFVVSRPRGAERISGRKSGFSTAPGKGETSAFFKK
jgi:hypothetical protein